MCKFKFILLILLLSFTLPAYATPGLEGTYAVTGSNPGAQGGTYSGSLTIKKMGDVYHVAWSVGTTYEGIGLFDGNNLSVAWGSMEKPGFGIVVYEFVGGTKLIGKWSTLQGKALGTEMALKKN